MVTKKKEKNVFIIPNLIPEMVEFSLNAEDEENKIVKFKKQIMKKGEFKHPQNPNKTIDVNDEVFDEIISAWDAGALDNVPILLGTHDEEQTIEIVGRVVNVYKSSDGNKLFADMEIADADVIEKIETKLEDGKGLIDEVSVSIAPVSGDEGDNFKLALWHVAIVTHAWFTGMDSFEKLAAHIEHGSYDFSNIFLASKLNAEDLNEKSWRIRRSFYEQNSSMLNEFYVEEVHEDFVIVIDDSSGKLFKFSYTENQKDGLVFGEGVEVQRVVVEVTAKVEAQELLDALKEAGVEVDSIEGLKTTLETAANATTKADEDAKVMATINAALNPEADKDEVPEAGELVKVVASVVKTVEELKAAIVKKDEDSTQREAEMAVEALMVAGKVVPAKKDAMIALYKQDATLFATITSDLEVVVTTGENGTTSEGTKTSEGPELVETEELDVEAALAGVIERSGTNGSTHLKKSKKKDKED